MRQRGVGRLVVLVMIWAGAGLTVALNVGAATSAPAASVAPTTVSVTDTTPGTSQFTVPYGVQNVSVAAVGAAGGTGDNGGLATTSGGDGASVGGLIGAAPGTVSVPVTAGEQLTVQVGGTGTGPGGSFGGVGGGGNGGDAGDAYSGGGGGGASGVLEAGTALVIAGGGGGGGGDDMSGRGGNAGVMGTSSQGAIGGGPGVSPGGAAGTNGPYGDAAPTSGSSEQGGTGGTVVSSEGGGGGGGGGGGYYGGGGGGAGGSGNFISNAGGGGGSSYTATDVTGANPTVTSLPAEVIITYPVENLYAYAAGDSTSAQCAETSTPAVNGCSLAQALAGSAPGDTIYLATPGSAESYAGNWTVPAGSTAGEGLTLEPAPGTSSQPVLKPQTGSTPILTPSGTGTLLVEGLTLDGGTATDGGAIDNGDGTAGAALTVVDDTFSHDSATEFGGAIADGVGGSGALTVEDSTFSSDGTTGADLRGGAIADLASGTSSVSDSTFVHDSASSGGAIFDGSSPTQLAVVSSTLADDTAASDSGSAIFAGVEAQTSLAGDLLDGSCYQSSGGIVDAGDNVSIDASCQGSTPSAGDVVSPNAANLGNLASNGGPTQTALPQITNPAIDAIAANTTVTANGQSVALCPQTDQRGFSSPAGAACAAGAVQPSLLLSGGSGTATDGVGFSSTVTATGDTGPYTYSETGTLPTGLSLNSTTGVISGTATQLGSFPVLVQAGESDHQFGTEAITLTVNAGSITITPSSLPAAQVGDAYQQTLTASGDTAPYTWTVSSGALPAGLSLSPTGQITGTPSAAATSSFTVVASDASTGTAAPATGAQSYTLTVAPVPVPTTTTRTTTTATTTTVSRTTPTRTPTTPTVTALTCPAVDYRASRAGIGPLKTGETVAAARRALPTSPEAAKVTQQIYFCYAPSRLQVGVITPTVIRRLKLRPGTTPTDTIAWVLSSSPSSTEAGVHPGESVRAAVRQLRTQRPFHVGSNTWYLIPGPGAVEMLKVQHAKVEEVGAAEVKLSDASRSHQLRFLTAFF